MWVPAAIASVLLPEQAQAVISQLFNLACTTAVESAPTPSASTSAGTTVQTRALGALLAKPSLSTAVIIAGRPLPHAIFWWLIRR